MPRWTHDRTIGLWVHARAEIHYVRKHTDGVSEIILRCESLAAAGLSLATSIPIKTVFKSW